MIDYTNDVVLIYKDKIPVARGAFNLRYKLGEKKIW
jgi:hypothetical protein